MYIISIYKGETLVKVKKVYFRFNFSVLGIIGAIAILAVGGFLAVSCLTGEKAGAGETIAADTLGEAETSLLEQQSGNDFTVQTILISGIEEGEDIILAFYRNPDYSLRVLEFFGELTGSEAVAAAIVKHASALNVPPALAFALCWEESRYNPQAFNRNRNETVDRGLFQLNSATFPELATDDFYDLDINSSRGLAHLRWCLDTAGTDVAGLAMYNAGTTRVRSAGTPKGTLDYISRILKNQRKIEELFIAGCALIAQEEEDEEADYRAPFRLSLLAPLGGR